jgi:hypothetical protein
VDVAGNALATPDFTWSPGQPQAGQPVTFTATAFTDPDGSIARYEWDLDGDGTFEATGRSVTHSYSAAGTASAALRYVDDRNEPSPATTHAFTVVREAGGGPGGGAIPPPGQAGGTGNGAPHQPGAPGDPSSPANGTQGAGPTGAETTAPRLRIGARALAFTAGRARVAITVGRASTVTATLRRGATTLATATATVRHAGAASLTLKLTRAGTGALRRARGRMRASLTVVARPRLGGTATTVKKTVTVSR